VTAGEIRIRHGVPGGERASADRAILQRLLERPLERILPRTQMMMGAAASETPPQANPELGEIEEEGGLTWYSG